MADKITISKKKAMKDFFDTYLGVEGYLGDIKADDLENYLTSDIFVECAAAASGIAPEEFVKFGLKYLPLRMG